MGSFRRCEAANSKIDVSVVLVGMSFFQKYWWYGEMFHESDLIGLPRLVATPLAIDCKSMHGVVCGELVCEKRAVFSIGIEEFRTAASS